MSTTRQQAVANASSFTLPEAINYSEKPTGELFGENVFGLPVMKQMLSSKVYASIEDTIKNGKALDMETADAVAEAMKKWAISKGATHFGHIFYPLTNYTAEKNDSFYDPDYSGGIMAEFKGKTLIQQEPDGSSFPSGGIRITHEARGYTAWDVTSPAYLVDNPNGKTLTIPSAFISWTGQATDRKTPLMRSMKAVDKHAQRILKHFGHEEVGYITVTAGAEQEYFLIDKNFYYMRPDLMSAGRTLFGAASPKGQEFDDHYFGAINTRVQAFMYDFERELYKMGIPVNTRHNEVAPGQYEVAPVFESANVAADHQQVTMTTLQKIAPKYGFICLIHEKPFAGVNGSGKHVNLSLGNSTQGNLLDPTDSPHDNPQFLVFCGAFIRAVHKHSSLIRASIATASNDHRLGANEAPPAIISIFLGDQLNDVFEQIKSGGTADSSLPTGSVDLGTDLLPSFSVHAGDRNRTSPFAFTGNKFEFRAVGSSQSISGPTTVINTILAESLDFISTKLEAGEAVDAVLKEIIDEHFAVVFNGNGYSDEWHAEAETRGLPNLRTTADALPAFTTDEAAALFAEYGVYNHAELDAVYEVALEQYNMTVNVEANLVKEIAQTMVLPAGMRYLGELAEIAANLKTAGVDAEPSTLSEVGGKITALNSALAELDALRADEPEEGQALADYNRDSVLPKMLEIRGVVDELEGLVADDLWPLPTYQEMLFVR